MRDIADIIVDYQQADEDGVMVLISRQACEEAKAEIERLRQIVHDTDPDNQMSRAEFHRRVKAWEADGKPDPRDAKVAELEAYLDRAIKFIATHCSTPDRQEPLDEMAWLLNKEQSDSQPDNGGLAYHREHGIDDKG